MKKKLVIVIGFIALALSACGAAEEKLVNGTVTANRPQTKVISDASWAYPFVVWNQGQTYGVSNVSVREDEVGNQIGEVRRDISSMDAISVPEGETIQPYEQRDGDSNVLEEGSKLFALKGTDSADAMVVMHNGKYVKAVHMER